MLNGSMFIYDRFDGIIPDGLGFIWVTMIAYISKGQYRLRLYNNFVKLKSLNDLKVMVVFLHGFCFGSFIDQ